MIKRQSIDPKNTVSVEMYRTLYTAKYVKTYYDGEWYYSVIYGYNSKSKEYMEISSLYFRDDRPDFLDSKKIGVSTYNKSEDFKIFGLE